MIAEKGILKINYFGYIKSLQGKKNPQISQQLQNTIK